VAASRTRWIGWWGRLLSITLLTEWRSPWTRQPRSVIVAGNVRSMSGETDLRVMLASVKVSRRDDWYCFVTSAAAEISESEMATLSEWAEATVREAEGLSLVVPVERARAHGLEPEFIAAWLTLEVHSSLAAVGLTAAFSRALADQGISCNVIAGFHHDHLLVPADRCDAAVAAIERLAG